MRFDRARDWLAELRRLDLRDVGIWPRSAKAVAVAAAFCCTLLAGQFAILSPKQATADARTASEDDLKREYARKALSAARLDAARARHEDLAAEFEALLRQLPKDAEVPGLIEDISRAALANALAIKSIDLEEEKATGFYTELPIRIAVRGGYHDIGAFVSDVAALSRMVTLHDFELAPDAPDALNMTILAKTYSYLAHPADPDAERT